MTRAPFTGRIVSETSQWARSLLFKSPHLKGWGVPSDLGVVLGREEPLSTVLEESLNFRSLLQLFRCFRLTSATAIVFLCAAILLRGVGEPHAHDRCDYLSRIGWEQIAIMSRGIQEQSELSQSESDDQTTLRSRHSCKASRRERLGDYREGARPYVRAHAILCRAMWENHASHWLCLPVRTKGLGAPCLEEREEVCLGEEAFPTLQQGAPHMPHLEAYPPMRHAT
eukprot:scaffold185550_cov33-Tisochrysis_lutea.AAC.2